MMIKYEKKISSLKKDHPFIYHKALKRIKECRGNNHSDFITGFIWRDTLEGQLLWSEVSNNNFNLFYEFYNRINPLSNIPSVLLNIFNNETTT